MKIMHLSNTPLSNSPANLAQIQREAGHDSRLLLHRQSNMNKVFVGGDIWPGMDPEEIAESLKSADIIHFHNFAFEQELFIHHPQLEHICRQKPCIIQYHSPRKSTESFETTIDDPFFKGRKAVIAQFHVRQYPEAEFVVPNVLPIYDDRFRPLATKPMNFPARVSFAPSNVNLRGWEDKGFEMTRALLNKLERVGIVQTDIITNTPYEETLVRKKWADIGFEEIVTGSYHMSYLEYMSFGVATFCSMDSLTEAAMARIVGEDAVRELPSFQVVPETVERELVELLRDPALMRDRGTKSRAWMEKHWNPTVFNRHFEAVYAQL
jgi:hypothetical protein